jgi:hypothetical protein
LTVRLEDFAIGRVDPAILADLGEKGVLSHAELDPSGKYERSVSVTLIRAPIEKVVRAVERVRHDNGGFLNDVNMIHKFKILQDDGDRLRVRIDMRYRYVVLSFKFHVVADVFVREGGRLDLHAVEGKVKDLAIHFRLRPVHDGEHTLFYCSMYYDVSSLGWLVDYFLKHHPEIELGVFSASAPVISLALKQTVEAMR